MLGKREPVWRRAVTYAAVGATRADNYPHYPPKGFRAVEKTVRIGHGPERWQHAWTEALSLGIQRRSGLRVHLVNTPADVRENSYQAVAFEGPQPVQAAQSRSAEQDYSGNGTPLVHGGDTAVLRWGWGPLSLRAPIRVVYVIEEPNRRGLALGSLPGHPQCGEEAFVVERRDDGSVWLNLRVLSRPGNPVLWVIYPVWRLVQSVFSSRYQRALAGSLKREGSDDDPAEQGDADPTGQTGSDEDGHPASARPD